MFRPDNEMNSSVTTAFYFSFLKFSDRIRVVEIPANYELGISRRAEDFERQTRANWLTQFYYLQHRAHLHGWSHGPSNVWLASLLIRPHLDFVLCHCGNRGPTIQSHSETISDYCASFFVSVAAAARKLGRNINTSRIAALDHGGSGFISEFAPLWSRVIGTIRR